MDRCTIASLVLLLTFYVDEGISQESSKTFGQDNLSSITKDISVAAEESAEKLSNLMNGEKERRKRKYYSKRTVTATNSSQEHEGNEERHVNMVEEARREKAEKTFVQPLKGSWESIEMGKENEAQSNLEGNKYDQTRNVKEIKSKDSFRFNRAASVDKLRHYWQTVEKYRTPDDVDTKNYIENLDGQNTNHKLCREEWYSDLNNKDPSLTQTGYNFQDPVPRAPQFKSLQKAYVSSLSMNADMKDNNLVEGRKRFGQRPINKNERSENDSEKQVNDMSWRRRFGIENVEETEQPESLRTLWQRSFIKRLKSGLLNINSFPDRKENIMRIKYPSAENYPDIDKDPYKFIPPKREMEPNGDLKIKHSSIHPGSNEMKFDDDKEKRDQSEGETNPDKQIVCREAGNNVIILNSSYLQPKALLTGNEFTPEGDHRLQQSGEEMNKGLESSRNWPLQPQATDALNGIGNNSQEKK